MGQKSSSKSIPNCHYQNQIQDKDILGQKIIEGYEAKRDVYIWLDHTDLIFKTDKDIYFQCGFHCKEAQEDYQCSFHYYTKEQWETAIKQFQNTPYKFWEMKNQNLVINFIDIEKIYKDVANTQPYNLIYNNCHHLAEQVKKKLLQIEDLQNDY